ncbi:uncharacterized protein [Spinacia oleracea]|uniref:Retrotransposon gag domain-containing protein n=1 Tax=Spinacia oleracea TaxID=3562 RepID=A0ABM3RJF3_SPIOL|nr:uncharacterized protein LOC130470138 [Spinacia oleracea]
MKHWVAVNSMLVSWITNMIDETLRSTVEDFDIAGKIVGAFEEEIDTVCQTESVTDYFGRLSTVCKAYVQYARVPQCTCAGCSCNIAWQVGEIREEEHLHYFLIGLENHYEAIRAQLLAQSPLPSVDEAYKRLSIPKICEQRVRLRRQL